MTDTTETDADAAIEAVARALCKADGENPDIVYVNPLDPNDPLVGWRLYRGAARAVFAALAERGLAVVPADATAEIIDAGRLASECDPILGWAGLYAAMVRAGRVGGSR